MTLKIADRTAESTTTTGTGTLNLGGAIAQCQTFISGIGNGNTCFYSLKDGNGTGWEVGQGTVTSGSPNTFSRSTILASSNSGGAITLSSNTHQVFVVTPASHAVQSIDLDNAFGSTQGDILYRSSTGWTVLSPGTSTYVLTSNGSGANPSWAAASGGGGGLYSQVLSTVPTSSGTGLTTWMSQGSATVADTTVGICITSPTSTVWNLRSKAAPSTPYKMTALISVSSTAMGQYQAVALGWSDGTKLQLIMIQYTPDPHLLVAAYSTTSAFASTQFTSPSIVPNPCWVQIQDDGTTVYFSWSTDGINFSTVYSVAKSSGYLGGSGYSNVFWGANAFGGNTFASLLSYTD